MEDKTHLRWANNEERISQEALVALQEKMKAGQIARLEEVRAFLEERLGIHHEGVSALSRLLKRHQIKPKTGRPVATAKPPKKNRRLLKNEVFPEAIRGRPEAKKRGVFAMDEARFGLITCHRLKGGARRAFPSAVDLLEDR